MKLSHRIAAAGLDPAQRRRFLEELRRVAAADGQICEEEFHLIERLLPGADALLDLPAELDALWAHGALLVTACIYVAVSDGEYGVEEARMISNLAHQLGMSAHQLSQLEARTFTELAERAG